MKHLDGFRLFSLTTVWVWLALFALVPFCLVLFTSVLSHDENHLITLPFTLQNYTSLYDSLYFQIFARSFILAVVCTFSCLILGYPFAYIISRM
ncbi:MAG TPA: spermidine/putrescine ABC transporter permease PotB, partial [Gammaproteobacteria bacterium]|nr:spermidine/putrescine ABC transporter permease PotB [Gammaproteobacteria bacterium]